MNPNEKSIFIGLLNRLDDYLSYEGCNDMRLPDTPENRRLITEAEMWNVHAATEEEWKAHPDYHEVSLCNGELLTSDYLIFGYLRHKEGYEK